MPCVYVYNKIDQISLEEVDRYLPRIVHALQFVLLIVLAFMKISVQGVNNLGKKCNCSFYQMETFALVKGAALLR
jgi:hypothetical protein